MQSLVTMTLFLRTNLRPCSVAAGQEYYGVIFFSLIATMFDGFAEETLTVRQLSLSAMQLLQSHGDPAIAVRVGVSLVHPELHRHPRQVQRLPGWFKQRDNHFYPAWAYVFPTTVLRIPYSLLIALLWSVVIYYPVGLAPEPSR